MEEKIKKLQELKLKLVDIENQLEVILDNETYHEACDATGDVGFYIDLAIKKLNK